MYSGRAIYGAMGPSTRVKVSSNIAAKRISPDKEKEPGNMNVRKYSASRLWNQHYPSASIAGRLSTNQGTKLLPSSAVFRTQSVKSGSV